MNEIEIKKYILKNIGTTSKITLDIINNTQFIMSEDKSKCKDDIDLDFYMKPDYDKNIIYINPRITKKHIMNNIKRCIFYNPQWLAYMEDTYGCSLVEDIGVN